jgi:type II secretory pathway component PulM
LGSNVFEGDAHAVLVSVYKDLTQPMQLRLAAAQAAVRYEKPALSAVDTTVDDKRSYVARMPQPEPTPEQWLRQYGALVKDRDKAVN